MSAQIAPDPPVFLLVSDRPSDPIGPRPVANGLFVVYSGPWDW
ncbi:MAG: hypothetical protein ACERK6_04800 [Candidatus Aminicenantaceae bacterium]